MADLGERLQIAVGETYRIERELGGGGMSRVFVAEETALARQVVIKVLPPEMSAAVNQQRFQREIQLAASLQHPHIVPLLTAGAVDDLLYYVMPYIEGDTLGARLSGGQPLSASRIARILRDVADALSAAHQRGIVHRDIKPANVLLSGNHALVTDFGVAKAVTSSNDAGTTELTGLGVALGTPTYMAPEQALADPDTDHRADIYALGVLAYEMVTGTPPFVGTTPQVVLAAHVNKTPEPLERPGVEIPPSLVTTIMRCLEKDPAHRWQRAEEMIPPLEGLSASSGSTQSVAADPARTTARWLRGHPLRILAVHAGVSLVTLTVAYVLMIGLALPGWMFPATIALLLAGLPIVLLAQRAETYRETAKTEAHRAEPPLLGGWLTLRKAWLGGLGAFGILGAGVTVYTAMRLLGIGPVGTLIAAGVIDAQERVILANVDNRASDSTLGETVTELLRIDLSQSPAISVLEPRTIEDALRRMARDPSTTISGDLAREVAEREGVKAVVSGEIRGVGSGYVVSVRIVGAADGRVLAASRETAASVDDIVSAVDRLSADLRERIGESLRTIRADPPLARVTTHSTEALRKYALADRINSQGDTPRAIDLLIEAIADDTAFAMAYRKLGVLMSNIGRPRDSSVAMLRKAMELGDRLTDRERRHAEAIYAYNVEDDMDEAILAYQAILDKYPDDDIALNNISLAYGRQRRWDEAADATVRAVAAGNAPAAAYENGMIALYAADRVDEAQAMYAAFRERYPRNPDVFESGSAMAGGRGDYAAADSILREYAEVTRGDPQRQASSAFMRSNIAYVQGKLTQGRELWRVGMRHNVEAGFVDSADVDRFARAQRAWDDLWYGADPTGILTRVDELLRDYPMESLAFEDRPYFFYANIYSRAGAPERARTLLDAWRREADSVSRRNGGDALETSEAYLAIAEDRPADAIPLFESRDRDNRCTVCWLWALGYAHDRNGDADSTIVLYERFLNSPWLYRTGSDSRELPVVLRRLGELFEARGDTTRAIDYYTRFVELWTGADPALQPIREDVRGRIARLTQEPATRDGE